ncbi:hypothetical protein KQI52_03015 [bacterium]|nr:hypothetical protein [bacterium]
MNGKAIAFIVIVVVVGLAIWLLPGNNEPDGPASVPQNRMMTQTSETPAHQHADLPEIDSLRVSVQDSTGTDLATLVLSPDEAVSVPGTEYSLKLTDFYTHFMMEDAGPVNVSPHPENQAARIEIYSGDELVDYTWTFEKVPFFRMSGMGGPHDRASTGLAFAVVDVYGLDAPHAESPNP